MTKKYLPQIVFTVSNDLSFDRRMIRICNALHDSGIDVLLVGRRLKKSQKLITQSFAQKRISCWFESGKLFYIEYNIRLFFFLLSLKNIAVGSAIDLDTIWPVRRAAKIKKWKIAYDAHELFQEVPEVVDRPVVKKIWSWVAKKNIPKVDLAYTVGNQLAVYFSEKYGIDFHVIRNVPRAISAQKNYDIDQKIILYQGKINQGRGVREMIEVMAFFPKYRFWIIGDGDEYETIQNWAESLSYSNRIIFYGYIEPSKLADITAKVTLGINLLENKGLSYYYSLANKTFDYIQAGIPSIQMAFPEYEELQKTYNCFFLLDKLEVKNLRAILDEVLNNPQDLLAKHKNALEAGKELHWENESQKLISLYKELLKT